jgi:hypothetical protein
VSVAWTTLAIIIALLPGLFFLLGHHAPERFLRDVGRTTAVGELGIAAFVATAIHLCALLLTFWYPGRARFIALIHPLMSQDGAAMWEQLVGLSPWLLLYMFVTTIAGFRTGSSLPPVRCVDSRRRG